MTSEKPTVLLMRPGIGRNLDGSTRFNSAHRAGSGELVSSLAVECRAVLC